MNWASWLFLLASLWGAWFAYNALFPRSRGVYLASWSCLSGWLTGDLALHHIAWQAVATAIFATLGALESLPGQIGLGVSCTAWLGLAWTQVRSGRAAAICEAALAQALTDDVRDQSARDAGQACEIAASRRPHASQWRRLVGALPRLPDEVERIRNIQYARAGGLDLQLDIYRPRDQRGDCPVLLQIHGGAWVALDKKHQALPLMHRMASNGWVCVSVNYRLSPHATFPDHLIDAKRALAWVKQHIADYGGDPNFVIATGGSAGGHLCSLTALTANDPEYQPGFERIDTTVQGCIAIYGVYDLTGSTETHDLQAELLEKYVMKGSRHEMPKAYHRASPMLRAGDHAPPFFVIHGDCDTLVPVEQARAFVRELRAHSAAPVAYAELPGAQHAFEVFNTPRSLAMVDAVERFANTLHQRAAGSGRSTPAAERAARRQASGRPNLRAL